MKHLRLLASVAIVAVLLSAPPVALAQQPEHPGLDAPGFQKNRDYFSEMPFEHIDTLNGSVILTFTDLVLPGNAGRELKFQRTYNSKTGFWTFGIAGVAMRIANLEYPTGQTPEPQEQTPTLLMADGSAQKMAWYTAPDTGNPSTFDEAISSNFWRFNRAGTTRRLSIPNGDTCDYENDSAPQMLRVKTCKDLFNNEITFQWVSAETPTFVITQKLSPSVSRLITLEFAGPDLKFPTKLIYDGRTWQYTFTGNSVTAVTPPEGSLGFHLWWWSSKQVDDTPRWRHRVRVPESTI